MAKHRGRFKWKKYSRYKGNLRDYWECSWRVGEHHRDCTCWRQLR